MKSNYLGGAVAFVWNGDVRFGASFVTFCDWTPWTEHLALAALDRVTPSQLAELRQTIGRRLPEWQVACQSYNETGES